MLYAKISFEVGGIEALLRVMGGELREIREFWGIKGSFAYTKSIQSILLSPSDNAVAEVR